MPETNREGQQEVLKKQPVEFDILLGRHSNRFGGKYEWTDPATDEVLRGEDTQNLTPAGKKYAEEWGGANLADYDFVVGIGSMEPRTAETIDDLKKGAGKDKGLGANRLFGITFSDMGEHSAKIIDSARGIIKSVVAEYPNYGRLAPEERAVLRQVAQEKGMEHAMQNSGLVDEFAEGTAYNLYVTREIIRRASEGGQEMKGQKIAVPIVSHGGFNESFLMKCLQINGRTGLSLEELGGYFKPAEFFRLRLSVEEGEEKVSCEFTDPERQKLFVGKELTIDWYKVEELFHKYEERIKQPDYEERLSEQLRKISMEK